MSVDGRILAGFVVPAGETISVTTNSGGPTAVTVPAGTHVSLVAFLVALQAALIAARPVTGGTWALSLSTGAGATGKVTIAVTNGTYSITWTSTALRDLLGFAGGSSISGATTSTGTLQARGLWMPGCTFFTAQRYLSAPPVTDLRQTQSPTGLLIGHSGNVFYRHRDSRWTHVPMNRVWLSDETTTNESLERFLRDAQWGIGHSWFSNSSKCIIIAHDGNELGGGDVAGWRIRGCESMDALVTRRGEVWDGVWTVTLPELVSDS